MKVGRDQNICQETLMLSKIKATFSISSASIYEMLHDHLAVQKSFSL